MSTTTRQIVVVLPPASCCDNPDALLQAAAALAAQSPLKVLALGTQDNPAVGSRPLPVAAEWWNLQHDGITRLDAQRLVPALTQALQASKATEDVLLLLPPGALTEECAALLAAELQGTYLGRCAHVQLNGGEAQVTRAAYGGRVNLQIQASASLCAATWRPARDAQAASASISPQVHEMLLTTETAPLPQSSRIESTDRMPPLENAKLVVSGGRGMQGEQGFAMLAEIAQQLGASLGGSLPTVDAGWVPVARQIGQSGKFVNPRVYFTVGISGTPQHLAGVSTDSRIIAVNKDPQAPIFARAEVGVVAEWQDLLPALIKELGAASA